MTNKKLYEDGKLVFSVGNMAVGVFECDVCGETSEGIGGAMDSHLCWNCLKKARRQVDQLYYNGDETSKWEYHK